MLRSFSLSTVILNFLKHERKLFNCFLNSFLQYAQCKSAGARTVEIL
jgi:hypothetical protein